VISVIVLQPYLLHKEIGFGYREVYKCLWDCFKPMVVAGTMSLGLMMVFSEELWQQATLFVCVFVCSIAAVWLTLEKNMREYIVQFAKSIFQRNR
jgi:hypothetical protein